MGMTMMSPSLQVVSFCLKAILWTFSKVIHPWSSANFLAWSSKPFRRLRRPAHNLSPLMLTPVSAPSISSLIWKPKQMPSWLLFKDHLLHPMKVELLFPRSQLTHLTNDRQAMLLGLQPSAPSAPKARRENDSYLLFFASLSFFASSFCSTVCYPCSITFHSCFVYLCITKTNLRGRRVPSVQSACHRCGLMRET